MMPIKRLLSICLLLALWTPLCQAQHLGLIERTESNIGTYHYYYQPGEATIQVHVLGAVQAPGLYVVSAGMPFARLLALTGGPAVGTRDENREQRVILRLYRPVESASAPLYRASFKSALRNEAGHPELENGDVLQVEIIERDRFDWQDWLLLINTAILTAVSVHSLFFSGSN